MILIQFYIIFIIIPFSLKYIYIYILIIIIKQVLNNKLNEKSKEIEQLKNEFREKLQKRNQNNNLTIATNETALIPPASSLNTLSAEQSSLSQLISSTPSGRNVNPPVSLSVLLNSKDKNNFTSSTSNNSMNNTNTNNINTNMNNNTNIDTNNNNNNNNNNTHSLEISKMDNGSGVRELELKKQVQNLMNLLNESERNVRVLTKKENVSHKRKKKKIK